MSWVFYSRYTAHYETPSVTYAEGALLFLLITYHI
nr:MAG TPA: hypothetical protein [Caudoviricetes sp.]